MNSEYTNHSGGAQGADTEWEIVGNKYGVKTIAYSFVGHNQRGKNPHVLTQEQLNEGYARCIKAAVSLKRPWTDKQYIKNLLSRNWYQAKNADAIFAIATFVKGSKTLVDGGTGWAVQMAVDCNKPVYLFEQEENKWYDYDHVLKTFVVFHYTPTLKKNFAGIGTREINENGKRAIKEVYEKTFGKL